jgi:hypothetical protein
MQQKALHALSTLIWVYSCLVKAVSTARVSTEENVASHNFHLREGLRMNIIVVYVAWKIWKYPEAYPAYYGTKFACNCIVVIRAAMFSHSFIGDVDSGVVPTEGMIIEQGTLECAE